MPGWPLDHGNARLANAYRPATPGIPILMLEMSYPAVAGSVSAARRSLAAVAEAHGASEDSADAVRIAVSEAITNAVKHAYPEGEGMVHITAAVAGRKLLIEVADEGKGMVGPLNDHRGLALGLPLIAAYSEHCTVGRHASGGVQVEMRFDLESARLAA
jgi:anti-sigma regulatory factor (Ser/Thr protein kinase)